MAPSSFPAFSRKCTPSGGRCFLVFLVSVLGVCVSVYYITLRPAFPLIGTCSQRWGWSRARSSCSCLAGLALLAVRHALVRHYCTDILLFQGNGYRHIPRSRMGCPAGGKHLLPPVHAL